MGSICLALLGFGGRAEEDERQYGAQGDRNQNEKKNGEKNAEGRSIYFLNSSKTTENESNDKSKYGQSDVTRDMQNSPAGRHRKSDQNRGTSENQQGK